MTPTIQQIKEALQHFKRQASTQMFGVALSDTDVLIPVFEGYLKMYEGLKVLADGRFCEGECQEQSFLGLDEQEIARRILAEIDGRGK